MKHSYRKYGFRREDTQRIKVCGYLRSILVHQNQNKFKGYCTLTSEICSLSLAFSQDCKVYKSFEKAWKRELKMDSGAIIPVKKIYGNGPITFSEEKKTKNDRGLAELTDRHNNIMQDLSDRVLE
jgi:hypothetical protein